MENNKDSLVAQPNKKEELSERLNRLDKILTEKKLELEKTERQLREYEAQFARVNRHNLMKLINTPVKVKKLARTTAAYMVGKKNRKGLYSSAYKRKKAKNQLKKYHYYLYESGFTEKVLTDLETLFEKAENIYIKQAVAWELGLWYANKKTAYSAELALDYLQVATVGVKDRTLLREVAIVQAECYKTIGEIEIAKEMINQMLKIEKHPDLLLAAANASETTKAFVDWVNQALDIYDIEPIGLSPASMDPDYNDLATLTELERRKSGPKVSVIIPAYNSESSIQKALDSLINQTWVNIEIIVVDDCSSDKTRQVVECLMGRDDRIKLLSTPKNSGPYVARNIALQQLQGEYVTVHDADDWSHPRKIEIQVQHLMNHPDIIANTSEQARLTEDLCFHRRGAQGFYIFSNMSSLMFRKKEVMKKLGYWDSVRFAADSEFIRRMELVFGNEKVIHLKTGPLAFQRQTNSSLTGNSAYGYNGFLMGARKEYAEGQQNYHQEGSLLRYTFPQKERPFPVPEPMKVERKAPPSTSRHLDVIVVTDFRLPSDKLRATLDEIKQLKQMGLRTGLIQMSTYDFILPKTFHPDVRKIVDGLDVQILVYGENITCDVLIIKHFPILMEKQKYLPDVQAYSVRIVLDNHPAKKLDLRRCDRYALHQFGKRGKWFAVNPEIKKAWETHQPKGIKSIKLSTDYWSKNEKEYASLLNDWLVDENPYLSDWKK